MKKTLKGYVLGFLSASILNSCVTAFAVSTTTLYNVVDKGVTIVVDGKKLNPTDANGNKVEPLIYNGTTYLPVRAVANALGKAVYWDGPNYTVYLGQAPVPGGLPYPTVELEKMTPVGEKPVSTNRLVDNYANEYTRGIYNWYSGDKLEYLLNMKYSYFKGILYVPKAENGSGSCRLKIIADDKTIYTSPTMNKSSEPVEINVNVTGYNDIKIEFTNNIDEFDEMWGGGFCLCLGDAGFYQ